MGVLDDMTKGITDRKAKAAGPKLTPVGTEASSVKPSLIPKDLPNRYMAAEELTDVAKDLRERAAQLIAIADSLDLYVELPSVPEVDPKTAAAEAKKREEAEGDAKAAKASKAKTESPFNSLPAELPVLDVDVDEAESFTERLNKLSEDAIAALDEVLPTKEKPEGWVCPDHGSATLKELESRKGRRYMACQTAGCRQFEKESNA